MSRINERPNRPQTNRAGALELCTAHAHKSLHDHNEERGNEKKEANEEKRGEVGVGVEGEKEQKESQEDIQVMNFGFPAASSIKTSLSARLMTLCQPPLLWRSRFPFHVYSSVPGFPLRFLLSCRKPSLMIGQITATSRSIVYVCVSLTVRVCVSV